MNILRPVLRRGSIAMLATGLAICAAASAQSLHVIELQHRSAAEVIPVLEPLLESGAVMTGQDYKLFVRASERNVTLLRQALAQIDRQPRQLLVTVRRASHEEVERERASVSGTLRAGDGGVAVNERPRAGSGATVRAGQTDLRTTGEGFASVRVLEGSSALIATGNSVPTITTLAAGSGSNRRWAAGSTTYRDLNSGTTLSGFIVAPRVNGDQVILDISQQAEQWNGRSVDTQRLTTQVAGRLGEWIELGGVSESSSRRQSGVLERQYSTKSDARTVWVKVEAP